MTHSRNIALIALSKQLKFIPLVIVTSFAYKFRTLTVAVFAAATETGKCVRRGGLALSIQAGTSMYMHVSQNASPFFTSFPHPGECSLCVCCPVVCFVVGGTWWYRPSVQCTLRNDHKKCRERERNNGNLPLKRIL